MIAADTSTWIAFLAGDDGRDARLLDWALAERQLVMPPVVLTELLSGPARGEELVAVFSQLPLIEINAGYWVRAGALRAKVLATGRRARLGDALIAQSCLDRQVSLLTRDRDFQGFAAAAGLRLAV